MQILISYGVGLLFAVGLLVGGMANPAKVLAFLDVGGLWDPSLAFVMGGAITVGLVGFAIARRRKRTYTGALMQLPTVKTLDRRLVLGSLTFGIGWGLAGFCPGPAILLAGMLQLKAVVFVVAMLLGMGLFAVIERSRKHK